MLPVFITMNATELTKSDVSNTQPLREQTDLRIADHDGQPLADEAKLAENEAQQHQQEPGDPEVAAPDPPFRAEEQLFQVIRPPCDRPLRLNYTWESLSRSCPLSRRSSPPT